MEIPLPNFLKFKLCIKGIGIVVTNIQYDNAIITFKKSLGVSVGDTP